MVTHATPPQDLLSTICHVCGTPLEPATLAHPTHVHEVRQYGYLMSIVQVHDTCFKKRGSDWEQIVNEPSPFERYVAQKIGEALQRQTHPCKDVINRSIAKSIMVSYFAGRGLCYLVAAVNPTTRVPEERYWAKDLYDVAYYLCRGAGTGRTINIEPTERLDHEKWEIK